MVSPLLVLGLIPAMLLGRFVHELTHAAVAKVLGARIIRIAPSFVQYELPGDAPRSYERVIGAAPLVSGLLIGLGVLLRGAVPRGAPGVLLAAGWGIYTFWGDPKTDLGIGSHADHPE